MPEGISVKNLPTLTAEGNLGEREVRREDDPFRSVEVSEPDGGGRWGTQVSLAICCLEPERLGVAVVRGDGDHIAVSHARRSMAGIA